MGAIMGVVTDSYAREKRENAEKIERYSPNPENGIVSFYPSYLQIEQTNRCNAQCIMCNHFYLGNRGCSDISDSVLDKLTSVFPHCETVMLNGDGEPFLSPTITASVRRYHHYGIRIGTNTNLSYIPREILPYLRESFAFLNISCDGCTAATFETIRRGLSFESFLGNLDILAAETPHMNRYFDCVVMRYNISELPGIVRLASEYGIGKVKFQRLGVNPVIGNDADRAEYYYDYLVEQLGIAREEGQRLGIEVSCPNYGRPKSIPCTMHPVLSDESISSLIRSRQEQSSKMMRGASLKDDYYSEKVTKEYLSAKLWNAGKMCQWAVERCYVDLHGNVTTCCFNMKKNFGSLAESSFDEIWNGEEYQEFRIWMARKMLPEFCRRCNWIKDSLF